MDIEFIEEQHRDNIFKIMELCNCDMAEAYELYNNNACNVQNAVQAKFNSFGNQSQMNRHHQDNFHAPPSHGNNTNFNFGGNFGGNFDSEINDDYEYERYKKFKENGMTFSKRYEIRREQSSLVKGVLSFFKPSENNFKKKIQDYIGKRTNLTVPNGSLSEALESITKQKFPLVVHVLDFSKQANIVNNIRKVYTDDFLIQMFNIQFRSYGLSSKEYDLEPYLKQYIDLKNDANCLVIFRLSIIDEIVMVSKIPLAATTPEEVKKKLKQVKHKCITEQMDESHLQKRYQQELMGNYDYQKPMSLSEQRKLKEDREIRRKQEEEFYASMQPKQEEFKPTYNTGTSGYSKPTEVKPSAPKRDLKAEAQQERQKIKDSLKIYESDGKDMLTIKLRLPSSQHLKLYVPSIETAQYLYDFVLSRENDLGFENDETRRVFDIIEPYEKINLSEKKGENLGKIFEGETMLSLVVNEKAE